MEEMFGASIWEVGVSKYRDPPLPFTGPDPGCKHPYKRLPTIAGIFEKFWEPKTLRRIVRETNRYASKVIDKETQETRGGNPGILYNIRNSVRFWL